MPARKLHDQTKLQVLGPEALTGSAATPELSSQDAIPELALGISRPGQTSTVVLLECGVDEVGIGSAIAEVYAASCILNPARRINGLRDSKQLTPQRRKELSDRIKERALDYCIATASLEEIERFNVLGATLLAMARAVEGLKIKPDIVLIDGNRMPKLSLPARTIVKGDTKVKCISAASILAKVARDEAMLKYHEQFPQYGIAEHKGYLTEAHFAALKQFGPCPIHRKSYEPVRMLLEAPEGAAQLTFVLPADAEAAEDHDAAVTGP